MPQISAAERVAANVRAELARQGFTQTWLAQQLGCSQATVNRRLSGGVVLDMAELEQIAHILDIPLSQLLNDGTDKGGGTVFSW